MCLNSTTGYVVLRALKAWWFHINNNSSEKVLLSNCWKLEKWKIVKIVSEIWIKRHVINFNVGTSTISGNALICKKRNQKSRKFCAIKKYIKFRKGFRKSSWKMGSILAKGNDNLNNNNMNDRHDIFMDCNSDIMASPSSTLIANHIRQPSIRSRNLQPMPNASELDRRFARVLVSQILTRSTLSPAWLHAANS